MLSRKCCQDRPFFTTFARCVVSIFGMIFFVFDSGITVCLARWCLRSSADRVIQLRPPIREPTHCTLTIRTPRSVYFSDLQRRQRGETEKGSFLANSKTEKHGRRRRASLWRSSCSILSFGGSIAHSVLYRLISLKMILEVTRVSRFVSNLQIVALQKSPFAFWFFFWATTRRTFWLEVQWRFEFSIEFFCSERWFREQIGTEGSSILEFTRCWKSYSTVSLLIQMFCPCN